MMPIKPFINTMPFKWNHSRTELVLLMERPWTKYFSEAKKRACNNVVIYAIQISFLWGYCVLNFELIKCQFWTTWKVKQKKGRYYQRADTLKFALKIRSHAPKTEKKEKLKLSASHAQFHFCGAQFSFSKIY